MVMQTIRVGLGRLYNASACSNHARDTSFTIRPASTAFKIAMIWCSLNLLFRIEASSHHSRPETSGFQWPGLREGYKTYGSITFGVQWIKIATYWTFWSRAGEKTGCIEVLSKTIKEIAVCTACACYKQA